MELRGLPQRTAVWDREQVTAFVTEAREKGWPSVGLAVQVVVCETTKKPWGPDYFRHVFRDIADAAGIPKSPPVPRPAGHGGDGQSGGRAAALDGPRLEHDPDRRALRSPQQGTGQTGGHGPAEGPRTPRGRMTEPTTDRRDRRPYP